MAEHPPRDDSKKAHEAKRNGDDIPEILPGGKSETFDEFFQRYMEVEEARKSIEQHDLDIDLSESLSDIETKEEQQSADAAIPAIERIPFDPHSVLSVDTSGARPFTGDEQKMQEEMDALPVSGAKNELEADVQEQINRNRRTRARGEFIAGVGERVTEDVPMMDGTPKEWKQKLIELVGKFGEDAKEKAVGGAERMKAYLAGRSGELDTAIAAKTEKGFRSLGEWYGKLGWKSKLAVGLSLGIGMGVSAAAGASIPAALGLIFTGTGIAAQRVAGLSAMFLKYEKSTQDGKWKKEKAMGKAILYTAGMTGAMMLLVEGVKEAINFANQSHKDEAILRWIGSMTGNKALAPDATPAGSGVHAPAAPTVEASPAAAPETGGSHEVAGRISSAAAPEAVAPATIEMPSVKASAGHGYEYMMKRLWEDLHAKGVELPANANPDSDLARLLAADEDSIDKLVHDLAADSKHQFFRADGSSVLIAPDAQMTIGARGELFLSDAGRELQVAPAHVAVTPAAFTAPHVESPAPTPEALDLYFGTQSVAPQEINPLTGLVNEQTPAPVETAVPHTVPEQIISPEPIKTVDLTPAQDAAEAPAPVPETPTSAVDSTGGIQEAFTNVHGTPIDPNAPAIYEARTSLGEKILVAYGGNDESRFNFMQKFLQNPENQGKSIRWAHSVPSIMGPRIQVDELGAQTTGGRTSWFPSFFSRPVELPDPKSFEKLVTK